MDARDGGCAVNLGHQPSLFEKLSGRILPFVIALAVWIVCPSPVVLGGVILPKAVVLFAASLMVAVARTIYVSVQTRLSRGRIFSKHYSSVGTYWLLPVLFVALYLADLGIPSGVGFPLLRNLLLGVGIGTLAAGLLIPRMSYGTARSFLRPQPHSSWEYARMVQRLGLGLSTAGLICLFAVAVL